jgi:hypothetical protein
VQQYEPIFDFLIVLHPLYDEPGRNLIITMETVCSSITLENDFSFLKWKTKFIFQSYPGILCQTIWTNFWLFHRVLWDRRMLSKFYFVINSEYRTIFIKSTLDFGYITNKFKGLNWAPNACGKYKRHTKELKIKRYESEFTKWSSGKR